MTETKQTLISSFHKNSVPLEKADPEVINRILNTAAEAEAEKYSDPQRNPFIKVDYEDTD